MRLRWFPLVLLVLGVGVTLAPAQPPPVPKEGPWVIPLAVSGVTDTKPALRHRLLPELKDYQSGNQVQAFYKCFFEQHQFFHSKEAMDQRDKWNDAPLKDLAGVKELIDYGGAAVKQANYAARLDGVDWQITNQAQTDGIYLLLPDVQQMRMLAYVLKIRVRGEIARGEFDNAIHTLQTMFALGRTFNEQPTLIGSLVGIAITAIALGEVEEFIQQPGAPNLFWALADLPNPFIDLRKGSQGEKLFLKGYHGLRKATPLPDADLNKLAASIDAILQIEGKPKNTGARFKAAAADKAALDRAKALLVTTGYKPADLDKLPPLQIVMMADLAKFDIDLDEMMKWSNFPFWQIPADIGKLAPDAGPFGELLPAWYKVLSARTRQQQQVALLMAAEAVRAYAGANGGMLPTSLADIRLPVPVDPYTGKPFAFEAKDDKATIRSNPPAEVAKNPANNRAYEITIRK